MIGTDNRTGYERARDNEHVEAQDEAKRLKERLAEVVSRLHSLNNDFLRDQNLRGFPRDRYVTVVHRIITFAETGK